MDKHPTLSPTQWLDKSRCTSLRHPRHEGTVSSTFASMSFCVMAQLCVGDIISFLSPSSALTQAAVALCHDGTRASPVVSQKMPPNPTDNEASEAYPK